MNKTILIGRLTKDPDVRRTGEDNSMVVARYTLAVDRRVKKEDDNNADFINCVVFGKGAEFAEKYLTKGMKIAVTGRIQTGSFTNKDGNKVYTTDVIIEEQEFCESKNAQGGSAGAASEDGFVDLPKDLDGELPFV
ncbi:MAG: single-stranded DNA-binding protein [Pseudobutyrivibrio sp.]|nr:single-stranded DNA-binding protein [Pseudobutyrivibrio sp.]